MSRAMAGVPACGGRRLWAEIRTAPAHRKGGAESSAPAAVPGKGAVVWPATRPSVRRRRVGVQGFSDKCGSGRGVPRRGGGSAGKRRHRLIGGGRRAATLSAAASPAVDSPEKGRVVVARMAVLGRWESSGLGAVGGLASITEGGAASMMVPGSKKRVRFGTEVGFTIF
ncbi:leucine-rich repeat extensin-like protein 3 [Iris pallida]|uniref:Leucine-rich repeat extensin-like protein 3 n=1 Tax=Iris pallida TaxID=29817 RepID=A0AAX6HPG0_IRIPA|nr:leucine-rich repeat extensin-like protein 3 [Iris pallida]